MSDSDDGNPKHPLVRAETIQASLQPKQHPLNKDAVRIQACLSDMGESNSILALSLDSRRDLRYHRMMVEPVINVARLTSSGHVGDGCPFRPLRSKHTVHRRSSLHRSAPRANCRPCTTTYTNPNGSTSYRDPELFNCSTPVPVICYQGKTSRTRLQRSCKIASKRLSCTPETL